MLTPLLPGMKKVGNTFKPFDIEFGPFIEEINAREKVIRECADGATMERIKSKYIADHTRFQYSMS